MYSKNDSYLGKNGGYTNANVLERNLGRTLTKEEELSVENMNGTQVSQLEAIIQGKI